jgi:hypothetical protein
LAIDERDARKRAVVAATARTQTMMRKPDIWVDRVSEQPSSADGTRVLVDRIWSRD